MSGSRGSLVWIKHAKTVESRTGDCLGRNATRHRFEGREGVLELVKAYDAATLAYSRIMTGSWSVYAGTCGIHMVLYLG